MDESDALRKHRHYGGGGVCSDWTAPVLTIPGARSITGYLGTSNTGMVQYRRRDRRQEMSEMESICRRRWRTKTSTFVTTLATKANSDTSFSNSSFAPMERCVERRRPTASNDVRCLAALCQQLRVQKGQDDSQGGLRLADRSRTTARYCRRIAGLAEDMVWEWGTPLSMSACVHRLSRKWTPCGPRRTEWEDRNSKSCSVCHAPFPTVVSYGRHSVHATGNQHVSFRTTKIGTVNQILESNDPEGLRVFYYLVQDLKCLVFTLMNSHFRIQPISK